MKKRLLSLALALSMTLCLTVPSFAAGEDGSAEWQDGVFNDGVYEGYYAQLDDLQKLLYDKIKEAFAEPAQAVTIAFEEPILLEAKDAGSFTEEDVYQWMRDNMYHDRGGRYAVFRDHPELPWLLAVDYRASALGEYLYNDQDVCTGFRMTGIFYENTYPWVPPEAYTNPSALEEAASTAAAVIGEARPSRAATVRAIHDYLCELVIPEGRSETLPDLNGGAPHTVYYDQTSYNALVPPNHSICNGYSAAFKLLCDRYEIPCVHLSGTCWLLDGTEGNHAWNYVQLEDGNWYAVDPTWDDGQTIGYDHFLVGKNTVNSAGVTFADMHETPPYNNYLPACPTLSDTAYPYLEAALDAVPERAVLGETIQLQLNAIKDLSGALITDGEVGLFEGNAQTPIASGRIQAGSTCLDYASADSGLGAGRHTLYLKCTEGAQRGAILAAVEITLESKESVAAFTDVAPGAYYEKAVQWAVEQNITSGTSETTFSPDSTCSKAQILTFLWRAAGSPEPDTENPFADLSASDYYCKAALWASEKGLVSGSAFEAGTACTRAMTVDFLWKLAGAPVPQGQAGFADVSADASYAQAVAWAVEQNITSGTSETTFSPDSICTRGQIVTFLYAALGQ